MTRWLLVLLVLVGAYFLTRQAMPGADNIVDLPAVGMSVELDGAWHAQAGGDEGLRGQQVGGQPVVGPEGDPRYGAHYFVSWDSAAGRRSFNEFFAERHGGAGTERATAWTRQAQVERANEGYDIIGPGGLDGHLNEFDSVESYAYAQRRGDGPEKVSKGFIVHAIKGTDLYRIRVGGLAADFDANPAFYVEILRSLSLK